jgi:hypothetical protein
MNRRVLNTIILAELAAIFLLLMLLAAGSRLTDLDYLAERYQSLTTSALNAVRRSVQPLSR